MNTETILPTYDCLGTKRTSDIVRLRIHDMTDIEHDYLNSISTI